MAAGSSAFLRPVIPRRSGLNWLESPERKFEEMSATVKLIHNAIVGGKFYFAGEPIEESLLPENLKKYVRQPIRPTKRTERQLSFQLNERYSVDEDGFLRGPAGEQAAQQEAIEDQLADGEVSPTVAAAMEEAREDYYADVERQKLQSKVKAEQVEAAQETIRQGQDERVANGEFDQWNAEALRTKQKPAARGASVGSKRQVKGQRSFVRRNGQFVLASSVEVIEGEPLYRRRPKSFGVSERYIAFGKVRKES
jgi:hypothetical protein